MFVVYLYTCHRPVLCPSDRPLAKALVNDLTQSLFPQGSPEAERIKVYALRSKHVVLSGGRWKHDIVEWLKGKGF